MPSRIDDLREHIAALARIRLTDEERRRWRCPDTGWAVATFVTSPRSPTMRSPMGCRLAS